MSRALLVDLLLGPALTGCPRSTATLHLPHQAPDAAARAWSTAFNAREADQLRLLVHPSRRPAFDQAKPRLQLDAVTVQRWALGGAVVVDGEREGREVTFWYHDGVSGKPHTAVVVRAGEAWWFWTF